jgi:hypothetical protein
MLTNLEIVREREIGVHWLTLSRYKDDGGVEFHGVAVDCIVLFKGTLAECEGKWRQLVRALNAADRRNKGRKEGGAQ